MFKLWGPLDTIEGSNSYNDVCRRGVVDAFRVERRADVLIKAAATVSAIMIPLLASLKLFICFSGYRSFIFGDGVFSTSGAVKHFSLRVVTPRAFLSDGVLLVEALFLPEKGSSFRTTEMMSEEP